MQSNHGLLCAILMECYKTTVLTLADAVFGSWFVRITKAATDLFKI